MKILHTHQISSTIIELIDESKEYCYLISPYIEPWTLLERSLEKAARQRKRITFIVRNENDTLARIKTLHATYGFEFMMFDWLHSKLYCNERRALVSSMNLYDGSQKRNQEIGALFDHPPEANAVLEDYILGDLLATPPRLILKGYLHEGDKLIASEMKNLEARVLGGGYCARCGTKMDLDLTTIKKYKKVVRCSVCHLKEPWISDISLYRTHHCHFCGERLESNLVDPFHPQCWDVLSRYTNWVKFGRRGETE